VGRDCRCTIVDLNLDLVVAFDDSYLGKNYACSFVLAFRYAIHRRPPSKCHTEYCILGSNIR